jgi:uncharacterized protein
VKSFPCPICKAAMPAPWQEYPEYPFCTKRCKLIDLGRWLGEGYAVPSTEPASDAPPPADPAQS